MQANLTNVCKYAMIHFMLADYHTNEHQKALLHEKINFHKNNMILQCFISIFLLSGAIYASQRKSAWLPIVIFPSMVASISKLEKHATQRHQCKQLLGYLERN